MHINNFKINIVSQMVITLLILSTLINYTHIVFFEAIFLLILVLLLIPNIKKIYKSKTGMIIFFQLIVTTFFLIYNKNYQISEILNSLMMFSNIAVFLIFMTLFLLIFKASHLDVYIVNSLLRYKEKYRKLVLLIMACLGSIGLSFGTNIVFGSILPQKNKNIAATLSRAIVLTMLLLPTTGSVAALMIVYSKLNFTQIVFTTFPIFLFSFILAYFIDSIYIKIQDTSNNECLRISWSPIFVSILVFFICILLKLPIILAMSWSALFGFMISVKYKKVLLKKLGVVFLRSINRISPEILLFIITGLLIWSISNSDLIHGLHLSPILAQPYIIIPLTLTVMIVTSLIGLHPMMVFSFFYPLSLSITQNIPDYIMYSCWLIGFILSLLLSPVSVLTATSSFGSGLSISQSCYPLHWKYVGYMYLFTILYLLILFYIF
nr:hypothetical protein [Acinetobacter sp. Marseille-Q1620]